jgi:thymidylate synthase (FAD)
MEVKLLSYTQNPQEVIFASARQCYSKLSAAEIYEAKDKIDSEKLKKFLSHLISRGHLSPFEHVSFTFAIEGVSRVCTHQLVRHRLASYSQQSQRYVSMDEFPYIIPPVIDKNPQARKMFLDQIEQVKTLYKEMRTVLEEDGKLGKEDINQDLRFLLPQACETKIVVTMNVRELMHFFAERLCLRAQWEIRALGSKMVALVKPVLPEVFDSAGAKCIQAGVCPDENSSCPLYPADRK